MPLAARNDTLIANALLEEYKALRAEIASRSTAQSGIIALNLTGIAAVAALFSYVKDGRVFFLVPVLSSILGAMYTDHALNIGKIGRFIRWQVKPRLAEVTGAGTLLDYEVYVNNFREPSMARRHLLPLAIISTFVAVPLLALIGPFVFPASTGIAVLLEWGNVVAAMPGAVLLVWFVILYFPAHYGGHAEASAKPTGVLEVNWQDSR